MSIAAIVLIIISVGLLIGLTIAYRGRTLRGLRIIPAFQRLRRAVGLAVEDGSRLHVSLGSGSLLGTQAAPGLVGLSMLDRVARLSSTSDRPPIASTGEGALGILAQDTLRAGFREAGALEQYDSSRGRVTGVTPFSYAVGAMSSVSDEQVSANILAGHFGPEVVFITDAAEGEHSFTLAGSDSLPGQAVLYAAAQEPLIGEELFAGGAYLQAGPMHAASLRVQDILRWGLTGGLVVGALLKLVGIL